MTEFLVWMLSIAGYGLMAGVGFRVLGNTTSNPDEPWETPGPFFGALLWPLLLPAVVGMKMVGGGRAKQTKIEQRRKEEIAEAQHRKQLAAIAAEELAINESSLNLK